MIPSEEGLIVPIIAWLESFRGQMTLDLIWLIAGTVGCTILTVMKSMTILKASPPLTTQVDLMTGKKDHSIGRWWLFYASFTIAPPLMFGIVRTLIEAVDRLNEAMPYWWVAGMLIAVSVGCALIYRRYGRKLDREYAPVEQTSPEALTGSETVGWSLPPEMPQWDARA